MGLFDNLRDKFILEPLAGKIIKATEDRLAKAESSGAVGKPILRSNITPYGTNANLTNRVKPQGQVSFAVLRQFSVQYDVARGAINRRKRQIGQLAWDIVPYEPEDKTDYSNQTKELKERFRKIGGYKVRFREFIDLIIEDLLVLDAVAIYKTRTMGGEIYSLDPIDGSTIQLRLDASGKTPMPPDVAYKQIIRGEVQAELTADELIYEMQNPRTSSPYGLSPLESLIVTVSSALKSELYNLNYLTDGNIPEGFFGVPESWTANQIKEFQEMWDAAMAGDSRATSRLKFVPDGSYTPTKKPTDMAFKEFNEWLMMKTCMLFEIPPQELGFTMNVNRANGEVQQQIGVDSGIRPLANFLAEIFTDVIREDMGHPELSFKFLGLENHDAKAEADTGKILIESGQRTINEVRKDQGKDPIADPQYDKLLVSNTLGFIDSETVKAKAEAEAAANAAIAAQPAAEVELDEEVIETTKSAETRHVELVSELRAFRKYAVTRLKEGKKLRPFESDILPNAATNELNRRLSKCADVDEAKAVFREYFNDFQINFLADVAEFRKSLSKVV